MPHSKNCVLYLVAGLVYRQRTYVFTNSNPDCANLRDVAPYVGDFFESLLQESR